MAVFRVSLFAFLFCLSFTAVAYGKQDVPFQPIHTGSIHADHFSPLSHDGVDVANFEAGKFNSGVLDFASLHSATPVDIGLAGGIVFDNENLAVNVNQYFALGTQVNNLNIEAPSGLANFQGENTFLETFGGDIVFESIQDGIQVEAGALLDVTAAGLSVQGNYHEGGVEIHAPVARFTTSLDNLDQESISFTGRDITMSSSSLFIDTQSTLFAYGLDKIDISSENAMNINAVDDISVTSLAGPLYVDANTLNIQSPELILEASGSFGLSSVLGHTTIAGRSGVNFQSADQVKFTSSESGVFLTADRAIEFTANDSINLISSSTDDTEAVLTSNRMRLLSSLGEVHVEASDSFVLSGNTFLSTTSQVTNLYAQSEVSISTTQSLDHVISDNVLFDAAHLSITSIDGTLDLVVDDDMFVLTDETTFQAAGFVFTISDDFDAQVHHDAEFVTANDLNLTAESRATLYGEYAVTIESGAELEINSKDIDITSGHSIHYHTGDLTFNVLDDISIDSPSGFRLTSDTLQMSGDEVMSVRSSSSIELVASSTFNVQAGTITLDSTSDTSMDIGAFLVTGAENVDLNAGKDLHLTASDRLALASDTTTELLSGDNIRFQAGRNFEAEGSGDLLFDTNNLFLFARKDLGLSSGVLLDVDASQSLSIKSDGPVNIDSGETIIFDAGFDLTFDATYLYHDDINLVSTDGSHEIIADIVDINGHRLQVESENILLDSLSFDVTHSGSNPNDFGDIYFTAEEFTHTSTDYDVLAMRDIDFRGTEVIFSATTALTISTEGVDENINIQAEEIELSAITITANSEIMDIVGSDEISFEAGAITMTAVDVMVSVDGMMNNSSISSPNGVSTIQFQTVEWIAENLRMAASELVLTASTSIDMIAYGDGIEYHAINGITIAATDVSGKADENIFLSADAGAFGFLATDEFASIGGDHVIQAIDALTIRSNDAIEMISEDNGFLAYNSGGSILVDTVNTFSVSPISTRLTASPGRFGVMNAEAGDFCVLTTDATATDFLGHAVHFSAYGPDATIDVTSTGATLIGSDDGSISLDARGFITSDPQFFFDPTVTFGILMRTAEGNPEGISVNSVADIYGFAEERFLLSTNSSSIIGNAVADFDIRTMGHGADISAATPEGSISIDFVDEAIITAGSALLRADLLMTATKDIILTSEEEISFSHLGTTTGAGNLGIFIESFQDMTYLAGSDISILAEDGGHLGIETRGGDGIFTSIEDQISMFAERGSIAFSVRGNTVVSAIGGIDIESAGDGGSTHITSGGEQELTIMATVGKLFVTADHGEIDVEGTTGFDVSAGEDVILTGKCISVEGGSVIYEADTSISFSTTGNMGLDADVDFLVDATTISMAAADTFSLSAGGLAGSPGISTVATGNIAYESANGGVIFNAERFTGTTTNGVSIIAEEGLIVEAIPGSSLSPIISLTTLTTDAFLNADLDISISAHTLLDLSSANALITALNSLSLSSSNDILLTTVGDWTTQALQGAYLMNGFNLKSSAASLNYDAASISILGDSSVEFEGSGVFGLTSDAVSYVLSDESIFSFSSGDSFAITANNNFIATIPGPMSIFTPEAVSITATTSMDFTSFDETLFHARDVGISLNTDLFTSTSEYFLLDSESFRTEPADISFTSTGTFSATSETGTIGFFSDTISISGHSDQPFTFEARDDISFDGTASLTVGTTTARYVANGDDLLASVQLETPILIVTSDDFDMISARDILLSNDASVTIASTDFWNVESYGHGGITIESAGDATFTLDESSFTAETGNIFIDASMDPGSLITLAVATGTIDFVSTNNFGAIRLHGGPIVMDTPSFVVQQYHTTQPIGYIEPIDSARSGYGQIDIIGDVSILNSVTALSLISDDNVMIDSEFIQIVTNSLQIQAGTLVEMKTNLKNSFSAGTSFDIIALGEESMISYFSNSILFDSDSTLAVLSQSTEILSNDDILVTSEVHVITANTFDAVVERGDALFYSQTSVGLSATGPIQFQSVGEEAEFILSATLSTVTVPELQVYAEDSIHALFDTITATTLEVESASDFALISEDTVIASASDLALAAKNDGIFALNGAGPVSVTATNNVLYSAEGMLGAIGGRFVLLDDFYNGAIFLGGLDAHQRKINRNTNGIEVVNVDGDVTFSANTINILAQQGSIEVRAQEAIRYQLDNDNDRMYFFGIDAGAPTVGSIIVGQHVDFFFELPVGQRPPPFATDYCNGLTTPNVQCAELSRVVNDIIRAMVAYNLFECSAGAGPTCF